MKHSLLSLTVALAAVLGFGVTAAAQTSVYATGNFTGIPASWDPENPVELTYADGVYTLDLTGAKQGQMFKLSTAKGDWTTFNASCFGVAADNTTATLMPNVATTWAVGNLGNNAIPASGDFKLVVDLDAKTMTLVGEGTTTDIFDIYLRGDVNSWNADEAYKFKYTGVSSFGEQMYELILTDGLAGEFKIADSSWSEVNYGADATIAIDSTTEVFYNSSANLKSTIAESIKLTFYHNLDKTKSSWLKVDKHEGVSDITVDDAAAATYYNLQGIRVAEPSNGLYIKAAGNTVTKVYVK